jgi:hypothetical protein
MDFGPYDVFPSSDVPEMVDQQNSWNSLVIGTYLRYLTCNVRMLVVNICILLPPTPVQGTPGAAGPQSSPARAWEEEGDKAKPMRGTLEH